MCKIRPRGLNTSYRGWEGIFAFWRFDKNRGFFPPFLLRFSQTPGTVRVFLGDSCEYLQDVQV